MKEEKSEPEQLLKLDVVCILMKGGWRRRKSILSGWSFASFISKNKKSEHKNNFFFSCFEPLLLCYEKNGAEMSSKVFLSARFPRWKHETWNIMKNLDYTMEKLNFTASWEDSRLMMMLVEWWKNIVDTIYDENYSPTFIHCSIVEAQHLFILKG